MLRLQNANPPGKYSVLLGDLSRLRAAPLLRGVPEQDAGAQGTATANTTRGDEMSSNNDDDEGFTRYVSCVVMLVIFLILVIIVSQLARGL